MTTRTWIDEKAHAELARVRKAREQQVYPLFREMEKGGLHTADRGQGRHQLPAPTTTWG